MKFHTTKIISTATTIVLSIASNPVIAQVLAAQNAGSQKANSILQIFLDILIGVGAILGPAAIVILGYKAWFEPNFKLSDGKNILIGGVLVSCASAFAAYFRW